MFEREYARHSLGNGSDPRLRDTYSQNRSESRIKKGSEDLK